MPPIVSNSKPLLRATWSFLPLRRAVEELNAPAVRPPCRTIIKCDSFAFTYLLKGTARLRRVHRSEGKSFLRGMAIFATRIPPLAILAPAGVPDASGRSAATRGPSGRSFPYRRYVVRKAVWSGVLRDLLVGVRWLRKRGSRRQLPSAWNRVRRCGVGLWTYPADDGVCHRPHFGLPYQPGCLRRIVGGPTIPPFPIWFLTLSLKSWGRLLPAAYCT